MKFETCLECGGKIGKYGKTFCSSRCAALYNNRNSEKLKVVRRGPLPKVKRNKNCVWCGAELKKSSRKFCSRKCQVDYYANKTMEDWRSGKISGTSMKGLSVSIRNQLIKENNYSCSKCNWNGFNTHTNSSPLEINHIDGNAYNNNPKNIEVLCPNCHSLTKNHSGANRGNGRRIYLRKYYIRKPNGNIISG